MMTKLSPADMAAKLRDMSSEEIRDDLQAYTVVEIKEIGKIAGIKLSSGAIKGNNIARIANFVGLMQVHRGMKDRPNE